MHSIGIIGTNPLAMSLLKELSNYQETIALHITGPDYQSTSVLAGQHVVTPHRTIKQLAAESNAIVICAPTDKYPQILSDLGNHPTLIISTTPNLSLQEIQGSVPKGTTVIRAATGITALSRSACTLLYSSTPPDQKDVEITENIMRSLGIVTWTTSEANIDFINVMSNSIPALFFAQAQTLQTFLEEANIPPNTAKQFIHQMVVGTAKMMAESDENITTLMSQSAHFENQNGAVEACIKTLGQSSFKSTLVEALKAGIQQAEQGLKRIGK